jgi:hypothetical protein
MEILSSLQSSIPHPSLTPSTVGMRDANYTTGSGHQCRLLEERMPDKQTAKTHFVHATLTALKYGGDGRSRFVSIPCGSVIMITGTRKEFDFVNVEWQGEPLAVFNRDIEEHTREV